MRSAAFAMGKRRQAGVTLLVTLIMLIMITLIVVMSFNIGESNLKIVSNAQDRQRATMAAEAYLNDKLNLVASEIVGVGCDFAKLTGLSGGSETVDGVKFSLTRSVIAAECKTNAYFQAPFVAAVKAAEDAQKEVDDKCVDPSTPECAAATAALDAAKAAANTARVNFTECARKAVPGVQLGTSPLSYCADVIMEVRVDAEDGNTSARAAIMRGISLICPGQDIPGSGC